MNVQNAGCTAKEMFRLSNKKKLLRPKFVIAVALMAVTLFLVLCSSFRCSLFGRGTGECISVAIGGKFELRNVDRAIVSSDGKVCTITDVVLLEQLVSETKFATHVNLCSSPYRRIDLYCGDKLVRAMEWSDCCYTVKVYEPGLTHWLIAPLGTKVEGGYVELSKELVNQLNTLMAESTGT